MDNNFSAYMLADQVLQSGASSVAIKVRLPWYRALPLSTVEIAQLRIDGREIPPEHIRFEINGVSRKLPDCADQIAEWWYVLDDGLLRVDAADLGTGLEHEIDVTLTLYPPYMPGFAWVTHSTKRLKVQR